MITARKYVRQSVGIIHGLDEKFEAVMFFARAMRGSRHNPRPRRAVMERRMY